MTAVLPERSAGSTVAVRSSPVVGNDPVRRAIAAGFLASLLILLFSSMRGWPFHTLTAAPWLFQLSSSNDFVKYGFLAGFYASVALLCWSWVTLLRASSVKALRSGTAAFTYVLWSLPLLITTPLFSGDIYVYVIDGLMVARGLDPYSVGASALGPATEVLTVHPLWRDTPSMYGPLFMRMMQGLTFIVGDDLITGVLIFRVVVFAAIGVMGVAVWNLAKRLGRRPGEAFVFAVLNPLTMLHMVGGGHNDGLMLSLLLCGYAVGVGAKAWPRRGVAIFLCVLAAEVKAPGLTGVVVLGWIWAGGHPVVRRLLAATAAGIVGLVMFVLVTAACGLGWGWTNALDVPGLAHPLLAPANAVGLGIGGLVGLASELNSVTRVVATIASLILAVYFVVRTGRTKSAADVLRATGWSLIALAWLGPAVYPWYLVWGLTLVGLAGAGSLHRYVVGAVVLLSFAISPDGYGNLDLVGGFWRTLIALALTFLLVKGIKKLFKINGVNSLTPKII